jgi:hypothetical protein
VPGGGISLDGRRWISSRSTLLLPVRVLGARRMAPGVTFAKISATGLNVSRGQFPIHVPPGEKSHSPRQRRSGCAITSTEQDPKFP